MPLPRTVADVLSNHVTFEVESLDRMYLNVWVPGLSHGGGVAAFLVGRRGHLYASTALMDPMTKTFVADVHHFIAAHDLELMHFGKGDRKDDITQRFLASFTAEEGVLYVGRTQEKAGVWRTQRRTNPVTGNSYAWLVRFLRADQPLLLLLRGRRLRTVLPLVGHLLPLHRQAVHQRQRMGQDQGRRGFARACIPRPAGIRDAGVGWR